MRHEIMIAISEITMTILGASLPTLATVALWLAYTTVY